MNYDVQIGNTIRRGISYAELIVLPIEDETFVRRNNGAWLQAKDCVELSHVLSRHRVEPPYYHNELCDTFEEESLDDYDSDETLYDEDEYEEPTSFDESNSYSARNMYPSQILPHNDNPEEERIFIPTAEYFKCKQKRKAAIIGVCTLGLAALSLIGVGNTWRSNLFEGTSFMANEGLAFVLKCISFCFLTALIALPYFVYSVFALIYYSVRLNNLQR